MKKSLSMLLAVLMVLSVFSVAVIPVGAANVQSFFSVSKTDLVNDEITYTVSLKGGLQKITGAIVHIEYNPSHLSIAACSAAGSFTSGMFEKGNVTGNAGKYGVGYVNADGVTLKADSAFFTIKFKAISADRPETTVKFSAVELLAKDNQHTKAEAPQLISTDTFKTLGRPVISAVDSIGTNALKVQWNACQGADSYNVYRKNGNDWVSVATGLTALEYNDTTIVTGTEYTYLVTAVNETGETDKVGNGKAGMNFGAITDVDCVPDAKGIKVTWGALEGAVKYDVLRKKTTDASFTTIKTGVTTTPYVDETAASGTEYNYIVKAYHSKGYTATTQMNSYPVGKFIAMPKLTVANTLAGVELTINAVGGADKYVVTRTANGASTSFDVAAFSGNSYKYTDTGVAGNTAYTYSVYAQGGSIKGSATTINITRLATPTLGAIENVDSGVKFSWSAVSGATQYAVYRKASGESTFSFLVRTKETSVINANAENGKTYTYTVAAENGTGTGTYNATGKTITRIATPASVTAKTNANGVVITWSAVSGAQSYNVYRSGKLVGDKVTGTTFTDKPSKNTEYTYTVCANIGNYSSARTVKGAKGMDFGTVTTIKSTPIQNGVTISWNKLDNAKGYRVWRKTASDASYGQIATVTSGTQYNDTKISSGVVYYYIVEAYNGDCVAEMTASPLQVKYLAAPTFTAKNSGDNIKITINSVYGAEKYVIERAIGSSTAFTQIKELPAKTLEFVDSGSHIVAGEKYTYRIKAVAGKVESFKTTVSMHKMIAPKIYSFYNEVAGVQIKWTAVADATQYKVYRKLPNENTWKLITTTGKSKTEFLDASVVGNVAYQYTVEANTPDGWTGYNDGIENRFIETPDLTSRASAVGGVSITWRQVAGATSYRIYRRGAASNYWYYLGDVPATQSSFLDKEGTSSSQIKSGNYYRYTVRAVYLGKDSKGAKHERYSGFDTNGLYLKYMATPKLTSISNAGYGANEGLKITWNKVNGGGTTWYRVYRRGAGSSSWRYLGATQGNSWLDKETKNYSGNYYRYTVRAVAGTKDTGWYSAFDTGGLYLKRVANPVLVSAVKSNAGITLKWGAVRGTTGYYIYRKQPGTTWQHVGTVKGTNNVTFLDRTAKKGVTYTYTVRACYGTTRSSYNPTGISCKR